MTKNNNQKVVNFVNSLVAKINNLISIHNSNSDAHSSLFNEKADKNDIPSIPTSLQPTNNLIPTASSLNPIDLKEYTTTGFYYYDSIDTNFSTNQLPYIEQGTLPYIKNKFTLMVEGNNNDYIKQTLTELQYNNIYTRTCWNGNWTQWKSIYPIQNIADSVTLTANKDMTYTGDTVTLTATALDSDNNGVSDVILTVYQDNISKGIITTDENGIATYNYISTGIGDTTFYVTDTMISSAPITLTDLWYYNYLDNTVFTSTVNVYSDATIGDYMGVSSDNNNIALRTPVELPSKWELSWDMSNTRGTSAWNQVFIGTDSNNRVILGKNARTSCGGSKIVNGTSTSLESETDNISEKLQYHFKITYQNGEYNMQYNNHNMTFTVSDVTPTYLLGFGMAGYSGNGARMRNIKIKKL